MAKPLSTDELLILLIEECSEVTQAATKCLRFGYTREWPGYGRNDARLSRELGEVVALLRELPLDEGEFQTGLAEKMSNVRKWRKTD